MSNMPILQSVCMSVRSLGYPKKKERKLEGLVSHYLRENGKQGLVDRFKHLQLLRTSSKSDTKTVSNYIRLSKHGKEPHNPVEKSLWALSDRKFFAITGAVIMSCQEEEVTPKQQYSWWKDASKPPLDPNGEWKAFFALPTDKCYVQNPDANVFYDTIRGICRPSFKGEDEATMQQMMQGIVDSVTFGAKTIWPKISQRLLSEVQSRPYVFSPSDVTKTAIPLEGGHVHHLKYQVAENGEHIIDNDDLIRSYRLSQAVAPEFMENSYLRNTHLFAYLAMLNEESNTLSDGGNYSVGDDNNSRNTAKYSYSRAEYNNFAKAHEKVLSSKYGITPRNKSVGSISFLPKPGLKARVVANPNRRVQADLADLGEAIQDVVYHDPRLVNHIFVEDQDKGRLEVASWLQSGRNPIASVDLHSATDTIDFNRSLALTGFTAWCFFNRDSIRRGEDDLTNKVPRLFMKYEETQHAKNQDIRETMGILKPYGPVKPDDPDVQKFNKHFNELHMLDSFRFTPEDAELVKSMKTDVANYLLYQKMETFNNARTSVWTTPEAVPSGFRYRRGQPLGTRPSFPLLTLTNVSVAIAAGASRFAVVGDDIVLDSRSYHKYDKIMSYGLGSQINNDKTMISSQFAEFVGYMFDNHGRIFPKKPRITSSKVQNAVRFGTTEHWLQELLDGGKQGMIIGKDSIASIPDAGKPISHRVNTANAGVNAKLTADAVVSEANSSIAHDESHDLPGETVAFHAAAVTDEDRVWSAPEEHISNVHYSNAVKFFDHHSMRERIVRDSLTQLFRRKRISAELAEELTRTGSAIYEDPQADFKLLFDSDGDGLLFKGKEVKAVHVTAPVYAEMRRTGDVIFGSMSQQRFDRRLGLIRNHVLTNDQKPSVPNHNDKGTTTPDGSALEL